MTKFGIVGYGNLGKACERVIKSSDDMTVTAVFSQRKVTSPFGTLTADYGDIEKFKDEIDIMLLCGGSATNLTAQSNNVIRLFDTADSFDTHALMNKHFSEMDKLAKEHGHIALIATGWDPGLFSSMRVLFESILPDGDTYTFWGKGVSQGHSEAIRKIDGVRYGIQYTVPKQEAIDKITEGGRPVLSVRDKHERVCFVVAEENADKEKIKDTIVNMPNYFSEYDTTVNFIGEEEFLRLHTAMPHGGKVIRSGDVSGKAMHAEFSIKLESNPDFTASVLVNYAKAALKLKKEGKTGAVTVLDVPVAYLSDRPYEELLGKLL